MDIYEEEDDEKDMDDNKEEEDDKHVGRKPPRLGEPLLKIVEPTLEPPLLAPFNAAYCCSSQDISVYS